MEFDEIISRLSQEDADEWLTSIAIQRIERRANEMLDMVKEKQGDFLAVYFAKLARSYGSGRNSDAFEHFAQSFSLSQAAHHRDNPIQVEALFIGQSGLLDTNDLKIREKIYLESSKYFKMLQTEYNFMVEKFNLHHISSSEWHFNKIRPQSFPYIRLSQLAHLFCYGRINLSVLLEIKDLLNMRKMFDCIPSEYWQKHYGFGVKVTNSRYRMTRMMIDSIIINAAIPTLYAWGKYMHSEEYCQRAIGMLQNIPAENNKITRLYKESGFNQRSAAHTQGLIELYNQQKEK